jgi:multiple sugar transport system substrate-binding protein
MIEPQRHKRHEEGTTRDPDRSQSLSVLFVFFVSLWFILPLQGCLTARADTRTEVRFCFFGGYEEWRLWQRIGAAFEAENPDIRMKLLYWPGANYEDKVKLVMAAGTAPDVMSAQDEPLPNYAELGQFEELTPYLKRAGEGWSAEKFFPTAFPAFQYQGGQYAIPWNGGQLMVYYNRELFRRAGLPDPPPKDWTIRQFTEYAVKLTRDENGDGRIDQFGYEINGNWMYSLIPYLWIFGTDIIDPTMTRCTLNNEQGIAAMQWLRDLRYKYRAAPQAAEFTGAGGAIFMTGKLGMEINGPWRLPFMRETEVDWDIWHVPVGPGGERWTRGTWDGLAMYRQSRVKEEAWRFILFATGETGQQMVAEAGRAVPPRQSAAHSPAFLRPDTPQHEERFLEGMSYFRTQRIPLKWAEMNVILSRETEAFLSRDGDVRAAARAMETEINKVLAP